MVRCVHCVAVLLLLAAGWQECDAQITPASGERYALLVGVRDYDKNELRPLPYSEADVDQLAGVFRDSGYRPENVVRLTQTHGARQSRFQPTGSNLMKELDLLLNNRDESDSVIVVMAGHGVQFQENDEHYFCPSDARLAELDTLIPLSRVYSALERSKAGRKLLLVDACRNDPQADNSRSRPVLNLESVTRPQATRPPGGVAAFFSCSAGEKAFEHPDLKHGVFFHFVIQGLAGEADFDRDRIVTLPELQQYAAKRVPDFVRAEYGVIQTPDLIGKTRGLFPILRLDPEKSTASTGTQLRVSGQSVSSRQIVQKVMELYEKQHYSRRKLDDKLGRQWLEAVIRHFDKDKLYFLQSDIDAFQQFAPQVARQARLGDVAFVWEIFRVWTERRTQRFAWISEYLSAGHDFTVDEEVEWVRTAAAPAGDLVEARELWRKLVKLELLKRRARGADEAEATAMTRRHFDGWLRYGRQNDDDSLLEAALSTLGTLLDAQTTYISPRSLDAYLINLRSQLVGIGAQIHMEDGDLKVVKVFPGGPAFRDGRLKPGDRILAIAEGNSDAFQDAALLRFDAFAALVRGKVGTTVRLKIVPKGSDEPVVYDLVRGQVEIANARSQVFTQTRRSDGQSVRTGYILLPSLYAVLKVNVGNSQGRSSSSDVERILRDFQREKVDVVVLDLRSNAGGSLVEAAEVLALFVDADPFLQIREANGKVSTNSPKRTQPVWDGPLMVLTGRDTGPGAEIVAGVIQDYRRGLLLGDAGSSGNSTIQEMFYIGEHLVSGSNPPNLGAAKITTKLFFLPGGRSNWKGFAPDLALPSFTDSAVYEGKALSGAAIAPAQFVAGFHVAPAQIEKLARFSHERQQVVPEFADLVESVRRHGERLRRTSISLEQSKFLAYMAEQINPVQVTPDEEPEIRRDAYLNEVLAIALDFAPRGEWQAQYVAGVRALRAKNYADAVRSLSAAVQSDPDRLEALDARARAQAAQGEWTRALEDAKACGAEWLPAQTRDAGQLKVDSAAVAALGKGQAVRVKSVNAEWLWLAAESRPEAYGWFQRKSVHPRIPGEPR